MGYFKSLVLTENAKVERNLPLLVVLIHLEFFFKKLLCCLLVLKCRFQNNVASTLSFILVFGLRNTAKISRTQAYLWGDFNFLFDSTYLCSVT